MADVTLSGTIPVRDPRTGRFDFDLATTSPTALAARCRTFRAAQKAWSEAGADYRAAVLHRFADAIEARQEAIAAAETIDTARYRLSHQVPRMVVASIRHWCEMAPGVLQSALRAGESRARPGVTFETQLVPYELVGVISPWNHPFLLSMIDAVPAVLAGCAVLVKPSEIAPRFALVVQDVIGSIPELRDVFGFCFGGPDTGRALIEQVDALCFTGSIPTGKIIARECASRFIPAFLELGGKDPVIVTASADPDRAADAVLRGAVEATGQLCFSIERVYVAAQTYPRFLERLVEKAKAVKLTYPDERSGHLGPFILEKQAAIVDSQIEDAIAKGARLLCGGTSQRLGGGVYMAATVLADVDHTMRIMQEETFGPVIPVMMVQSTAEAIERANDSQYGLSAAVIAGSAEEARSIGLAINAGAVSLQDTSLTIAILREAEKMSFGQSGLGGSRMGPTAMHRFVRRKVLMTNCSAPQTIDDLRED